MTTPAAEPADRLALHLTVNRRHQAIDVPADASLLDVLRDGLALTGTKRACDRGACGACTVLVDGRRVNACLTLAACVDGAAATTVEGLAATDGLQCGYCTPGQLVAATALLDEGIAPDRVAVAEALSGNLCRCGAYANIVDAVLQVLAGDAR